jgi:hypothetical protein
MFGAILALTAVTAFPQAIAVNLSGTVTDSAGAPLSGATVRLEYYSLSTSTSADGKWTLSGTTGLAGSNGATARPRLSDGAMQLELPKRSPISLKVFGTRGEELASVERLFESGSHSLVVPSTGTGMRFVSLSLGDQETWFKVLSVDGIIRDAGRGLPSVGALAKASAAALYDVVVANKAGYETGYVSVASSDSSGIAIRLLPEKNTFSFFVTSMKGLQALAKNDSGFGGDFRFGETGPGAGLRGADKICASLAELSMKGSSVKGWRAFLSVTADTRGKQVDAIDRVGPGPWYDRLGRVLALKKDDLKAVRPMGADPAIALDLPNEWGVPNHRPDPTKPADDNHHMVTGSNTSGTLAGATATCKDWTVADGASANGKPAHGYAWPRGGRVSQSGSNWMATGTAPGCGKGIEIIETGPGSPTATFIGSGGGYGGFYCFALNP